MSDPVELATAAIGGGGSVGVFVLWLLRRGEADAKRLKEAEAAAVSASVLKIDQVLAVVGDIKMDLRVLAEKHHAQTGELVQVKERVDGLSINHGGRLSKLEEMVTEVRTILAQRRRTK
jgi:hypothetical protein